MTNDTTASAAVQDHYPDDVAQCYGCGRLNPHGIQLKSRWDGEHTVSVVEPRDYHMAMPGYVYGGFLASIIDCHGTGSAALASYRAEGRAPDTEPALRFVTASLHVDYLKPTPLGPPLELRGRIAEVKGRKVVTEVTVSADGVDVARGTVVAVQMPAGMTPA